jgi:hypothetical protein
VKKVCASVKIFYAVLLDNNCVEMAEKVQENNQRSRRVHVPNNANENFENTYSKACESSSKSNKSASTTPQMPPPVVECAISLSS